MNGIVWYHMIKYFCMVLKKMYGGKLYGGCQKYLIGPFTWYHLEDFTDGYHIFSISACWMATTHCRQEQFSRHDEGLPKKIMSVCACLCRHVGRLLAILELPFSSPWTSNKLASKQKKQHWFRVWNWRRASEETCPRTHEWVVSSW